jgi:hypothetical protein
VGSDSTMPDSAVSADSAASDGPSGCGPGIYPCGPYGAKSGDVIENLRLSGLSDPAFSCKTAGAMTPDTQLRQLSLSDFHSGSASCPDKQKRVLWIFVSAGWCHACEVQLESLVPQYNQGKLDPRVELLQVLFEDNLGKPATEAFARTYAASHKLTHPLVIDPGFVTSKYFPVNATPLNMLVDLKTMEIFYAENGVNLQGIGKAMLDRLAN